MSSFVETEEFERLLEGIAANDSSLEMVFLNGEGIGDAGVRRLAEALRGNTSVLALYLRRNGIGPVGARALSEALGTNSSIKIVMLGHNAIGDDGARALSEMFRTNSTITQLILYENSISDDGAMALVESLRANSSVTMIDLRGNDIGDNGARTLANALQMNSSSTRINLSGNNIGDEGAIALVAALFTNSTVTELILVRNNIDEVLRAKIKELVRINRDVPNPEEAHRVKVERKIEWMLDSEGGAEHEAAVSLALAELDSFPEADRRRGLFQCLLGSPERGEGVAASADLSRGRVLYWYAAECGATPRVLINLLRAHPSLCACRDVKDKLYPFMLLATMTEAKVDDVMETLLENPSLVKGGIPVPDEHRATKRARVDGA